MTDGTCTYNGMYNNGSATAFVIKTSKAGLNDPIYIRYLHGDYKSINVGDNVTRGQLIGYSANNGSASSGPHLHLDFCWGNYIQDGLISGTLSNNKTTYTVNGTSYDLDSSKIDWTKVEKWRSQNNDGTSQYGYCWLVMASELTQVTIGATSTNDIVAAGKKVIEAHYDNAENLGILNSYYNQNAYMTTTIDGVSIRSRRDCSGFIDGVVQLLGDETTSYIERTSGLCNNPPNNWSVYTMNSSDLQAGDIVFKPSVHTELVVKKEGSTFYSYGLGSNDALQTCGKGGYLTLNPSRYSYYLRRKF